MRTKPMVLLAMVTWYFCGLRPQTVKVNWRMKAPFADYKSYAWKPSMSEASGFVTQFVKLG